MCWPSWFCCSIYFIIFSLCFAVCIVDDQYNFFFIQNSVGGIILDTFHLHLEIFCIEFKIFQVFCIAFIVNFIIAFIAQMSYLQSCIMIILTWKFLPNSNHLQPSSNSFSSPFALWKSGQLCVKFSLKVISCTANYFFPFLSMGCKREVQ